jgi:hypothetical protein
MTLLLLVSFLILFTLASTYANASVLGVNPTSSSLNVQVDQVTHSVQIREGGLVIINDTLKLSSESGGLLQNFSLGFPFQYSFNLDYCFAYDASNPDVQFTVERDVGLGRLGFYGINVIFPEPVNIGDGESYSFTVVFVFSNLISSETSVTFNATFPMYPSLTQTASACNVTVILPRNSNYSDSIFEDEDLNFTLTTLESRQILRHTKDSLDNFQYKPAWLEFNITEYVTPMININEVKREIKLNQWGDLQLSDFYNITNKGPTTTSLTVILPKGTSGISARDEMGNLSVLFRKENATTPPNATITFATTLEKNNTTSFTVTYRLPWKEYVNQYNWRDYNLTFTFFEQFSWTIRELTVSLTLPEGAEFESSSVNELVDKLVLRGLNFTYNVKEDVFQETVTFTFFNVTPFHNLDFNFAYKYLIFWASFRPTLWMGVLVVAVGAIAFLWRVPKAPEVPIIPVPEEDFRSFVEAYEEKTRILSELESMEEKLRKGRIPRRRYKVRKRMLEGRLSALSRELTDLREKIRAAGGRYANIMRRIEVAETMLEGVETDIRRVETRYRRGEISKGAYGKLLEEYHSRRERAMTTIDEVLLRLKEEIR